MKYITTFLVLITAISGLSFTASAENYRDDSGKIKNSRRRQSDLTEQTLIKLEKKLADALTEGNAALFESLLTDTFVFASPFGNLLNKTQVLDDIRSGALKMEVLERDGLRIKVNANTAIVTYRSTNKGSFRFVDISGQYQWIDVFENRQGQWKLIYQQGTPVRQSKQEKITTTKTINN